MPILPIAFVVGIAYFGYQEFQKHKARKEAAKEPAGSPVNPADFVA